MTTDESLETPCQQIVDRMIDELMPDGGWGSPKDLLQQAIIDLVQDSEVRAVAEHGVQILESIQGVRFVEIRDERETATRYARIAVAS
jgi:hypothetical protein